MQPADDVQRHGHPDSKQANSCQTHPGELRAGRTWCRHAIELCHTRLSRTWRWRVDRPGEVIAQAAGQRHQEKSQVCLASLVRAASSPRKLKRCPVD
jgi:hypothetical protein